MLIHSFVRSFDFSFSIQHLNVERRLDNKDYSDTSSLSVSSTAMLRMPFLNNGVPLSFAKTRAFSTIFNGVPDGQHITSTSSFNIFSLYANSSTFNLMIEPNISTAGSI